jgi:outer membrane lipoprotein-sorting protein
MNCLRLLFALAAIGCLLHPAPLAAVEAPFIMNQPSSADLTVMTKGGMTIEAKIYLDGDKMRSEMSMNGMDTVTIVRKDTGKIYEVLGAQKTTMEMEYDPNKFKEYSAAVASFGQGAKFELIGPATIGGVACTEYRVSSDTSKKVFDFWLDLTRKVPVKMAAEDGSFTVEWKDYQAGPQSAALFEPPSGYQVIPMLGMPGAGQ